jgi:hypothetical protein
VVHVVGADRQPDRRAADRAPGAGHGGDQIVERQAAVGVDAGAQERAQAGDAGLDLVDALARAVDELGLPRRQVEPRRRLQVGDRARPGRGLDQPADVLEAAAAQELDQADRVEHLGHSDRALGDRALGELLAQGLAGAAVPRAGRTQVGLAGRAAEELGLAQPVVGDVDQEAVQLGRQLDRRAGAQLRGAGDHGRADLGRGAQLVGGRIQTVDQVGGDEGPDHGHAEILELLAPQGRRIGQEARALIEQVAQVQIAGPLLRRQELADDQLDRRLPGAIEDDVDHQVGVELAAAEAGGDAGGDIGHGHRAGRAGRARGGVGIDHVDLAAGRGLELGLEEQVARQERPLA